MSKDEVARIFDQAAAGYDRTGPRVFSYFGQRLVEHAGVRAGVCVLDVAVGKGAILLAAAQVGGETVGVDLSMGMLGELVKEIQHQGFEQGLICQMDAEQLGFPGGVFDFVFCGNSICYFPEAVHAFRRVLKPGGKVGISIVVQGCFDWIMKGMQPYLPPVDPGDQQENDGQDVPGLDTPVGLAGLLLDGGFEDVQVFEERADFVYEDEVEWWKMMWTLGFRGAMEQMEPGRLEAFKAYVFEYLQGFKKTDGVYIPFRLLFAFGIMGIGEISGVP